jgi:hypothetical protein
MFFDTLQYIDAGGNIQEIALTLANVATVAGAVTVKFTPRSHAPSEFEIIWAQPPENGLMIPFRSYCIIYAGRTSGNGAQNSFSGGTILFQGRRWDNEGSASKERVSTSITILDAWKDLEKITFMSVWQYPSGGTTQTPTYSDFLWPDVVLMQALNETYTPPPVNGTYITTWQQIQDIFKYASTFLTGINAVQLQLEGAPEFVPVYAPWYPARSQKCADCIKLCLRPHPGVYTEIDYTTMPPTLHFRNVTTMTAVTLPYKSTLADGTIHIASDIQPLYELVPDAVRIYYRINGTFNGQPAGELASDIYPHGAPNSLLCLDYSIDITGAAVTETLKNFVSSAFSPTDLTLWRTKVPALKQISQGGQIPNDGTAGALQFLSNAAYNAATNPKGIQVIDDNGNVIDFTDTFIYWTDQSVYEWFSLGTGMAAQAVKATVKAFFSYQKQSTIAGTALTDTMQEHEHHFRVMLTNAPTNEYFIKTTQVGESIPGGLAQYIWAELQPLQWKLRHEIIQVFETTAAVPTLIKPGKHCINLSGGDPKWATMNAVPESVSIQLFRTAAGLMVAKHSISCGPVNHLEPGYLVQLTNMFWNRSKSSVNANQRLSGQTAGSQVDLSATDSKENSTAAAAVPSVQNIVSVSGSTVNGQMINSAPAIAAVLAATTPTAVNTANPPSVVQPQETVVYDQNCNQQYCIIHRGGAYTKAA